jgi:hypothetical protein
MSESRILKSYNNYLCELIPAFLMLAETLNVSTTGARLGLSRMTVKRYIRALEEIRGHSLFIVSNNKYSLTPNGAAAIDSAEHLMKTAENWREDKHPPKTPVERYSNTETVGRHIYLEEKGLQDLFISDTSFLQKCLAKWSNCGGRLSELNQLRDYGIVFRKDDLGWVLVEVGEKSSPAEWFGESWRISCIGLRMQNLPASDHLAPITVAAFDSIHSFQGARLDHIYTSFARGIKTDNENVSYKRLTLSVTFDDGSPALLSIAERSYDVRISELPDDMRLAMRPELLEHAKSMTID